MRVQGWGLLSIKVIPTLAGRAHFPSPLKTTVFPRLHWNTGDISLEQKKNDLCSSRERQTGTEWTGAELSRPVWRRAEQSCPAQEGQGPRATWPWGCLTALLFSQPCCTTIELFCTESSFLHHTSIVNSCWCWIGTKEHLWQELELWIPCPHKAASSPWKLAWYFVNWPGPSLPPVCKYVGHPYSPFAWSSPYCMQLSCAWPGHVSTWIRLSWVSCSFSACKSSDSRPSFIFTVLCVCLCLCGTVERKDSQPGLLWGKICALSRMPQKMSYACTLFFRHWCKGRG